MYQSKKIAFLFLWCGLFSFSQGKFVLQERDKDRINFKLINNLIVIPVEINGVELSFLLDTGVSKPIIFNFLNITEELKINQTEKLYLRGLGEGESVEALISRNNIFKIGNALSISQSLYAVFDPDLNFAPRLGVPIHGIIGYDFLKDFVVEINYASRYLKLYTPDKYKTKRCSSCEIFDIEFFNNKPYINAVVTMNNQEIPVTLLIDSGGSDALWLFHDEERGIDIPEKYFDDFLGRGLSGSVYGKRAKVDGFSLGKFKLDRVNVAFPDSTSISFARKFKERSGTISGEVLKRFNIIFDYPNRKISLKRNRNFSDPFYYNKSGISLEHDGVRVVKTVEQDRGISRFQSVNESVATSSLMSSGSYKYSLAPSFKIVELRIDSPAYRAGIEVGDVILNINNKHAHLYSLQQIIQMFFDEDGKRIRLLIDRKGVQKKFEFKLESMF
ncbi:MAG: aspartyl protease family protein [Flavobacteriaceae bacterium]|nr:aspartyl protease family protein [Flavobacteriaceae bacterium]